MKFVGSPDERTISMPKRSALHSPRPFVDTIEFGPFSLRDIEWIELPALAQSSNHPPKGEVRVPSTVVKQDVDKAQAILAELGRYPMERTERGLRINGHTR